MTTSQKASYDSILLNSRYWVWGAWDFSCHLLSLGVLAHACLQHDAHVQRPVHTLRKYCHLFQPVDGIGCFAQEFDSLSASLVCRDVSLQCHHVLTFRATHVDFMSAAFASSRKFNKLTRTKQMNLGILSAYAACVKTYAMTSKSLVLWFCSLIRRSAFVAASVWSGDSTRTRTSTLTGLCMLFGIAWRLMLEYWSNWRCLWFFFFFFFLPICWFFFSLIF
jgi:hypothetical protein